VVSLDSGRVLYEHSYTAYPQGVISSRDCRYLAEQFQTNTPGASLASWQTVIRRVSDGAIVARLQDQNVLTFSWNDQLVVTSGAPGTNRDEVDVLNWQTGKVLWRIHRPAGSVDDQPVYAFAQPNGTQVGVAMATSPGGNQAEQLWIVPSDGQAKQVLSSAFFSPLMSSY
jgi:hypothetical protein